MCIRDRTNTADNPTLNVNSSGAKAIQYRGAAINAGYLAANRTLEFVYDGSAYQLIGDLDTNTVYTHPTSVSYTHLAYAVNDILSFCDIGRLDEDEIETVKFGTLEDGGFLLDGSCQIMDESVQTADFGYWSAMMSDEHGSFSTNPKIERQFYENHSAAGLTLTFDRQYPLPKRV